VTDMIPVVNPQKLKLRNATLNATELEYPTQHNARLRSTTPSEAQGAH